MIIRHSSKKFGKHSFITGYFVATGSGGATTYATRIPPVPTIPLIKGNEQMKRILDAYFIDLTKFLAEHAGNTQLHKVV